jgi:hypothetical protein
VETAEAVIVWFVCFFNPQLKLWANAIICIELTHNFSCGSQNHNQKKISTISMVSEIFPNFAELMDKSPIRRGNSSFSWQEKGGMR